MTFAVGTKKKKKKKKKEKITINLRKIYNYKLGNSRNVTTLLKKKKKLL